MAVITNVDCNRECVDKLRSTLQVTGISEVFEVANITQDKTILESSYQHNLLSLLERCMTDADAAVVFKHHQQDEETLEKQREDKLKQEKREEKEKFDLINRQYNQVLGKAAGKKYFWIVFILHDLWSCNKFVLCALKSYHSVTCISFNATLFWPCCTMSSEYDNMDAIACSPRVFNIQHYLYALQNFPLIGHM